MIKLDSHSQISYKPTSLSKPEAPLCSLPYVEWFLSHAETLWQSDRDGKPTPTRQVPFTDTFSFSDGAAENSTGRIFFYVMGALSGPVWSDSLIVDLPSGTSTRTWESIWIFCGDPKGWFRWLQHFCFQQDKCLGCEKTTNTLVRG